jgi:phosphatidate cytidylyltransferase
MASHMPQSEEKSAAPPAATAASPGRWSDLGLRAVSALVIAPPVLFSIWKGGWLFHGLIALVALLSAREWCRLAEPDYKWRPLVLSLAAMAGVIGLEMHYGVMLGCLGAAIMTPILYCAAGVVRLHHRLALAAVIPYIAIGCLALVWLRLETGDAGLGLILFLLLSVWATDIGAYVAGRALGGPKLAPRISPKKTWAGLGGGVVCAALVGYAVAAWSGALLPWVAMAMAAVLALAGQAGDLFESHMKRRADVKDSGRLIPGHGGLLDRIDGLIFAAPVLALLHAGGRVWWPWW